MKTGLMKTHLMKGLTFSIKGGENVALLGKSGSGKS